MVDSNEFPSNSDKSKRSAAKAEPVAKRKKLDPIVTEKLQQRKPPLGKRLRENFFGADAHSTGEYVLKEVVLPAVKSTITDVISQGIERMLYGEVRRTRPGNSGGGYGFSNYGRFSQSPTTAPSGGYGRPAQRQEPPKQVDQAPHYSEFLIPTRGEAEAIIDRLIEQLDHYEQASVADLLDLLNITGQFTDNKWGWRDNLRMASVSSVRGGYLLNLPQPIPLD